MITESKIQSEILAYVLAVVFVFTLTGKYGKQAIEWLLMKLYEIFIQKNLLNL
jgi:hypothetical protein